MAIAKGQRTFNFAIKVSADDADAVEAIIKNHAVFMKEHHSLDASGIQLDHYYVAKAEELNDPTDPSKGATGNILYSINEVYAQAEGIGQHMEKATAWPGLGDFLGMLATHGKVVVSNGEVIETL